MNPDNQATLHMIQFDEAAEQVLMAITKLPRCPEKEQAIVRFKEMCYWFSEAHVRMYDKFSLHDKE